MDATEKKPETVTIDVQLLFELQTLARLAHHTVRLARDQFEIYTVRHPGWNMDLGHVQKVLTRVDVLLAAVENLRSKVTDLDLHGGMGWGHPNNQWPKELGRPQGAGFLACDEQGHEWVSDGERWIRIVGHSPLRDSLYRLRGARSCS